MLLFLSKNFVNSCWLRFPPPAFPFGGVGLGARSDFRNDHTPVPWNLFVWPAAYRSPSNVDLMVQKIGMVHS